MIRWNIGTASGTHLIPWGYGSNEYQPVTLHNNGWHRRQRLLQFSTYHIGWDNSRQASFRSCRLQQLLRVAIQSALAVMIVSGRSMRRTTHAKPALTNLLLTYANTEFQAPNTTTLRRLASVCNVGIIYRYLERFRIRQQHNVRTTYCNLCLPVTAANNLSWWACRLSRPDVTGFRPNNGNWNNNNWSSHRQVVPAALVRLVRRRGILYDAFDNSATLNATVSVSGIKRAPVSRVHSRKERVPLPLPTT